MLRCLAMGLCDESSAAALLRDLPGEFVRHGSKISEAVIEVYLSSLRGRKRHKIATTIKRRAAFEQVKQELFVASSARTKYQPVSTSKFPWPQIFVSGYGAGSRTLGTADYREYFAPDAVYSLFRYDSPLQNPELALRRIASTGRDVLTELRGKIGTLIGLQGTDRIYLTRTGVEIGSPRKKVELGATGDGLRATVTWVLDMLSWWLLYDHAARTPRNSDAAGTVLIDEIEQHLHPKWQRVILNQLTSAFPKIQFIATTHAPLVASGAEGAVVHRLNDGEHRVEQPFGWLAEDVYEMMGLPTSRASAFTEKVLDAFRHLDWKQLQGTITVAERRQLEALRRRLRGLPGSDPVAVSMGLNNVIELLDVNQAGSRNKKKSRVR